MTDSSWAPPPAGDPQVDLRAAFTYGWSRFKENPTPWVVSMLPLVLYIDFSVYQRLTGATFSTGGSLVVLLMTFLVGLVYRIVVTQGALEEVDGRAPAIGEFFKVHSWAGALGAAALVMILTMLPSLVGPPIAGLFVVYGNGGGAMGIFAIVMILLTLLAEVALIFLTFYALTFALDQRQPPVEALKSSVRLVRTNLGQLAPFALVCAGVIIGGALLCGVGIVVAIPVAVIASTYVYRVLVGGPIAALDGQTPGVGGYYRDPPFPKDS